MKWASLETLKNFSLHTNPCAEDMLWITNTIKFSLFFNSLWTILGDYDPSELMVEYSFFFQTNWPRNQAHSLYFAFILINLLVTTSANLFFVGWSVISCSAWSSRTCNKFCSPVRNSFHNQAFLEIFPGLQF